MDIQHASLYVQLDALFDTRMSTIWTYGQGASENVVANGYYTRLSDDFSGIGYDEFQKSYAQRNLYTLRNALITPVVVLITQFAKQTIAGFVNSPLRRYPKVVVNTYPYKLDDEIATMFISGIVAATEKVIDVELIYMSPEEVTPAYVKKHFVQMIMYDYAEWLDIHSENKGFEKTRCPEIILMAPALLKNEDTVREVVTGKIQAFEMLETYASQFIKLALCPASTFSVDLVQLRKVIAEREKTEKK